MSARAKAKAKAVATQAAVVAPAPAAAGAAAAVAVVKPKKHKTKHAEDMPVSQKRRLRQLCTEALLPKGEITLTEKAADSLDQALQMIVRDATRHANASRVGAGRVKLGMEHVMAAIQMHYPALLNEETPDQAKCLIYIDNVVRKVSEHHKGKQNARMEVDSEHRSSYVNEEHDDDADEDEEASAEAEASGGSETSSEEEQEEDPADAM